MNAHTTATLTVDDPTTVDPAADARRARVEELQRRRAAAAQQPPAAATALIDSVPRPRAARAGVAQGSKIATAGFGFAAMLGLVGLMGYASKAAASTPTAPTVPATPAQVVVVIHPANDTVGTLPATSASGEVVEASSTPIVLSAQPTVRQAPATQTVAGRTNGSR